MYLPCCPPLNKNMHHFSSFQVSFLLISEAFTNLTPSYQSKLLMEFGLGERGVEREVDCFREENYSLLSPITALYFPPGKNTLSLKKIILNNIIFFKKNQKTRIELISNFEFHVWQSHHPFICSLTVKDVLVAAHLMILELVLLVPQANLPLNSSDLEPFHCTV